jgi:hypothetical protein
VSAAAPGQASHTAGGCWVPCLLLLLGVLGLQGALGSHQRVCCLLLLLLLAWLLVLVWAQCLRQLGCQSPDGVRGFAAA